MKAYLLLLLMCMPASLALMVSPASHNVWHHQGSDNYTLTLINDDGRDSAVIIFTTGPDEITVPTNITLAAGETKSIPVGIVMPRSTLPGVRESTVIIQSLPQSNGMVGAAVAVAHVVRIRTPSQGSFVEAQIMTATASVARPTPITVSLTNVGTETIRSARAQVLILPLNQTLSSAMIALAPGETKDVQLDWIPAQTGSYELQATIFYDGKEDTISQSIIVGNLSISVGTPEFGDFRIGEVFRVRLNLTNEWGAPLHTTVNLQLSQNGVTYTDSRAVAMQPGIATSFDGFIDTANMSIGKAQLIVQLRYADKETQHIIPVVLARNRIRVDEPRSYDVLTYAVLGLLVLITIFIIVKKRRGPKHGA
jgi:hypothetical protein